MGEIANRDNKKMLILFAEVVAALATILIAVLAMKIPVVPGVCDRFDRGGDCCLSAGGTGVGTRRGRRSTAGCRGTLRQSRTLPVVYFDLCVCDTDTAGSKSVMIRPL